MSPEFHHHVLQAEVASRSALENGNTTFNLLLMLSKNLTTVLLHSNFASLELSSSPLFSQAVLALGNIAFNYLVLQSKSKILWSLLCCHKKKLYKTGAVVAFVEHEEQWSVNNHPCLGLPEGKVWSLPLIKDDWLLWRTIHFMKHGCTEHEEVVEEEATTPAPVFQGH